MSGINQVIANLEAKVKRLRAQVQSLETTIAELNDLKRRQEHAAPGIK